MTGVKRRTGVDIFTVSSNTSVEAFNRDCTRQVQNKQTKRCVLPR